MIILNEIRISMSAKEIQFRSEKLSKQVQGLELILQEIRYNFKDQLIKVSTCLAWHIFCQRV